VIAIKAHEVSAKLQYPPSTVWAYLIYGPDTGRVRETTAQLLKKLIPTPDSFTLVPLDGDVLASDPALLLDELNSVPMFGGAPILHVRIGSKNIASALQVALESPAPAGRLVVEAGDLTKTAPLRGLFEKSDHAFALPCYSDSARDLGTLVDSMMREEKRTLDPEARTLLLRNLGADRLTSKAEIDKLLLYTLDEPRITRQHIVDILGDVAEHRLDRLVDCVFLGKIREMDALLHALFEEGLEPSQVLSQVQRHLFLLMQAVPVFAQSQSVESALREWRGLPFQRKDAIAMQVRHIRINQCTAWLERVSHGIIAARRERVLAPALVEQILFAIVREVKI
jgi:DNA polymerase III subunit delta